MNDDEKSAWEAMCQRLGWGYNPETVGTLEYIPFIYSGLTPLQQDQIRQIVREEIEKSLKELPDGLKRIAD